MADRPLVLVVDDDRMIRELNRLNLEHHGYEVDEAENGAVAVEKALTRRPDVVLLDVQMPEMDGWETLERLRAIDDLAGVPVVMLTALGSEANEEKARSLGVTSFVGKPVPVDDLARVLARALAEPS